VITPRDAVPDGYRISDAPNRFEKEIWSRFWRYALDPNERVRVGIKNAQLEAPGSVLCAWNDLHFDHRTSRRDPHRHAPHPGDPKTGSDGQ